MDGLGCGALSVPPPTVVALDQAAEAHAALEAETLRGKKPGWQISPARPSPAWTTDWIGGPGRSLLSGRTLESCVSPSVS
jgi:hypothetical protein